MQGEGLIESEWCHTDVYDFMIFYVMSFFLFGFVWGGVVVWCFGKTNFFLKKSWGGVRLFFYWKEIAVFVFQTSSWGGVTGAGDLVVP